MSKASDLNQFVDFLKNTGYFIYNIDQLVINDGQLFRNMIQQANKLQGERKMSVIQSIYLLYNFYNVLVNSLHASYIFK